ncbi:hypothetical protein, partial [Escherichia coli]|uniref:hypothetical protein n=1 Tax=Escherichia coli TaxID=562 RepID=UPI00227FFE89
PQCSEFGGELGPYLLFDDGLAHPALPSRLRMRGRGRPPRRRILDAQFQATHRDMSFFSTSGNRRG